MKRIVRVTGCILVLPSCAIENYGKPKAITCAQPPFTYPVSFTSQVVVNLR